MDPRNGNMSEGDVNGPLPIKCAQMVSGEHTCFDSPRPLGGTVTTVIGGTILYLQYWFAQLGTLS